jgi:hypothetical protein
MVDPSKMTIFWYETQDLSGDPKGEYVVRVNPEKYSQTHAVSYDQGGAIGANNTAVKFERSPPATMQFELLFDGTGVIANSPTDVAAEIDAFQAAVYAYDGVIHSPRYLRIYWGALSFGARLTEMTVNYTMFRGNGSLLRARADVTFINYVDPETIELEKDANSPDLTRQVRVRAGDTLPLLTYRAYGDTRYYLEVARCNNLADFRHLTPGMVLAFPPLS